MAITKINEQTKAPALRNKVNEIVDAVNNGSGGSGGGGSTTATSRTVKVKMQGGMMENGYTKGSITTQSQFFNNCHSVLMMNIENCTIDAVALESGETLSIFQYDSNGTYISKVTSIESIDSSTCYVRFMLAKSTAYTSERVLSVTVSGIPTMHKNTPSAPLVGQFFSFETSESYRYGVKGTGSNNDSEYPNYNGQNERLYDNGWVILPPNYDPDGAPVPLAIYLHGTSGFYFDTNATTDNNYVKYLPFMEFVAKNGYAVADCNGSTSKYAKNASLGAPSMQTSVCNMIKYLTENYNIKQDGVYIWGKSAGGFPCHCLGYSQPFKIKAVGSMTPAISLMLSLSHHATTYREVTNMTAEQIGLNVTFSGSWGDTEKGYVLDNIDLWRQIDPFFFGIDLTNEETRKIVKACYDYTWVSSGTTYNSTRFIDSLRNWNTASDINTAEVKAECEEALQLLDNAKRYISCPTKIWIEDSDSAVSYENCRLYVEQAQRTGSPVFLRTLKRGTGGHGASDVDTKAIKTTYKTKYGGDVEIPVAYAELVDWFNRW